MSEWVRRLCILYTKEWIALSTRILQDPFSTVDCNQDCQCFYFTETLYNPTNRNLRGEERQGRSLDHEIPKGTPLDYSKHI